MILAVDSKNPLVLEAFSGLGEVRLLDTKEITPGTVRDADVLVVRSETKVGRELLEGSAVKFVGTATIGTDHVDTAYLSANKIGFVSAPGSNANSVKEYVVAGLLYLAAKKGYSLRGKTIGIVGAGNVGSKVAVAARSLGLNVLLNDPPRERKEGASSFVPFGAILQCDIISVHVPLTTAGPDATHHLFNAQAFSRLKRDTVFINTSRGSVVDTAALGNAIESEHAGWTILDVWENEPAIAVDLVPKITLATPHIAGYSYDGKLNAVRMIRDAVCKQFAIDRPWEPATLPPGCSPVTLQGMKNATDHMLFRTVHHAYDIVQDDRSLREILIVPPSEQGSHFRKLRAEYRIRREFSSQEVWLPKEYHDEERILRELGFAVKILSSDNLAMRS